MAVRGPVHSDAAGLRFGCVRSAGPDRPGFMIAKIDTSCFTFTPEVKRDVSILAIMVGYTDR